MNPKIYKILIVDDSLLIREGLGSLFEKNQWSVIKAENGKIGLDKLTKELPDIILLDLEMPELDGFQFLSESRKLNLQKRPYIFVMSGLAFNNESISKKAKILGAYEVFSKPGGKSATLMIDFQELLNKISEVLN